METAQLGVFAHGCAIIGTFFMRVCFDTDSAQYTKSDFLKLAKSSWNVSPMLYHISLYCFLQLFDPATLPDDSCWCWSGSEQTKTKKFFFFCFAKKKFFLLVRPDSHLWNKMWIQNNTLWKHHKPNIRHTIIRLAKFCAVRWRFGECENTPDFHQYLTTCAHVSSCIDWESANKHIIYSEWLVLVAHFGFTRHRNWCA